MAILNPEHLLDQAEQLIKPPSAGPPRQVDLRRAISAAYYAVFHATVIAAADQFVGVTLRQSREYGLVFRSVDHRTIRDICEDIAKSTPPAKYLPYLPASGFGPAIQQFANSFPNLQARRHAADYDPLLRFRTSDAKNVIAAASTLIQQFGSAPSAERKSFLFLLLFPPKR